MFCLNLCADSIFMTAIVLIIILISALVLQILTGGFPVEFFSFPLNVILLAIWLLAMLWIWKDRRRTMFVTHMLSFPATIASMLFVLMVCFAIGFTGMRWLAYSWVFVALLLYMQTVLLFVLLRGWREASPTGARIGPVRWRFILLHLGLLITIVSAFWGAPDNGTVRIKAYEGEPVSAGLLENGMPVWLDYEVELLDFDMESYENDVPSDYSARMLIDGKSATLRVNHPYTFGFGRQAYLVGYDASAGADSQYCTIQVVTEPWKYLTLAGIIMILSGALLLFLGGPRKRYNNED